MKNDKLCNAVNCNEVYKSDQIKQVQESFPLKLMPVVGVKSHN
jgi:hypothetical protein